jgi:hypothetical protein
MAPVSSIATYSDLQNAVADYLWRGDLATQIPLFIQMAEAEMKERVRNTTKTATISVSAYSNPMPSDLRELRAVRISSSNPYQSSPLYVVSPSMLQEFAQLSNATGVPQYAAVLQGQLILSPTPTSTSSLEVTYFSQLVPLSGTNPSNDVLVARPDMYLYGTLKHAAKFLQDDDQYNRWAPQFEDALLQHNTEREREEFGASLGPVRLPISFS